jgi:Immunity protein 8
VGRAWPRHSGGGRPLNSVVRRQLEMSVARLKKLQSLDVAAGEEPPDVENCSVLVQAIIGPEDTPGGDIFDFFVVTPSALATSDARWGRGMLIVPSFSWPEIERMVGRLLAQAQRPTWDETARALNKELNWEFDGYVSRKADV